MSRWLGLTARLRPASVLLLMLCFGSTQGIAGEMQDTAADMPLWPTPEGQAYEASRAVAAKAYIDCLLANFRKHKALSAEDAQLRCDMQSDAYAAFIPFDQISETLFRLADEVKAKH
jgi:hypothetical protein